jgi:dihydropteroate synthase
VTRLAGAGAPTYNATGVGPSPEPHIHSRSQELARRLAACYRGDVGRAEALLEPVWRARGAALMGVLNVTPDSFFDGGRYLDPASALSRVDRMIAEGAELIDIGGESSRPGAEKVPAEEQIRRIEPALRHAVGTGRTLVSVDTTLPEVADRMLALGAHVVNDVSCLSDPELARVTARHDAALIVMHSRGPMSQMPGFSQYPQDGYGDVVEDVRAEWRAARERALGCGMSPANVWLDPGIGFAKNARHSFEILKRLSEFSSEGVPVVFGGSRKSFIAAVDDAPADRRLGGTIAACLLAAERGAKILRVHDLEEVRQALAVARAAASGPSAGAGG